MEQAERNTRSTELIADFSDGFARGWFFAIRKSCREALDIKFTERVVDGEKKSMWTQGNCYAFRAGEIIYDTPLAYRDSWQDARKHIRVALQVDQAIPDTADGKGIVPGYVTFTVLRPDEGHTQFVPSERHTVSQAEFVALLQTGCLQGKSLG